MYRAAVLNNGKCFADVLQVVADLDNSHEVFGVATNFEKWSLLRGLDHVILCDEFNTITFDGDGMPVRAQLMHGVGKVHSLLE